MHTKRDTNTLLFRHIIVIRTDNGRSTRHPRGRVALKHAPKVDLKIGVLKRLRLVLRIFDHLDLCAAAPRTTTPRPPAAATAAAASLTTGGVAGG